MFTRVLVLSSMILLAACGGSSGDASKDSNGNCTPAFVSDYNDVVYAGKSVDLSSRYVSDSTKIERLQTLKNACDKFFAAHPGVVCRAEKDFKTGDAASSDLQAGCDAATQVLAAAQNPAPSRSSSGSGTSSNTARSTPECSSTFIMSYNNVLLRARTTQMVLESSTYNEEEKLENLKKLDRSCKEFYATGSNVSCRASISGEAKTVNSSDFDGLCKLAANHSN
jgi:hypothetical protein